MPNRNVVKAHGYRFAGGTARRLLCTRPAAQKRAGQGSVRAGIVDDSRGTDDDPSIIAGGAAASACRIHTPPPPPSPTLTPAATETPASADSPPESDTNRPRISLLPLVLVGVEPLLEARVFRHTEFTHPNLRQYGARGYPSIALGAEVFPLVNVKAKFLRGLGITLHYARAFGFQSSSAHLGDDAGTSALPVDTSFSRYAAGLRYRIHTNPESETPFVFAVSAGLGGWRFDFGPELPRDPYVELPTATYRMVRFGLDAALEVRRVTFYAAASYLHGFSIVPPNPREIDRVTYPYSV